MDPVAHLHAVAIDRQPAALQRVGDHQRDQLFRELVRSVVVGAAGDHHVQSERMPMGENEQVRRGLRGAVGAGGPERARLGELAARAERAVHLVGGDLQETLHPRLSRRLQQHLRAGNVRLHEDPRPEDAAIDVALRGQVQDGIDRVLPDQVLDQLGVRDVSADEDVSRILPEVRDRLRVACVGQLVEIDDGPLGTLAPQEAHEIAADEARAAGDQDRLRHLRLTSSFAAASESKVPASVHQPARRSHCRVPARR